MNVYFKCVHCHKKGIIGSFQDRDKDFYLEGWHIDKSHTKHEIIICGLCGTLHDVIPSLLKSPLAAFLPFLKINPYLLRGYFLLSDLYEEIVRNKANINTKEVLRHGFNLNDKVIDYMFYKGFFAEKDSEEVRLTREEFLKKFKRKDDEVVASKPEVREMDEHEVPFTPEKQKMANKGRVTMISSIRNGKKSGTTQESSSEEINLNETDAQFDLAYKLATGDGIEQDIPKAIDLYEPLAQEKDLVAMHNVALLYCGHYGDDPEKLARGIQYFKYAANHGYDPSNCEMMKLHLIGFGVEKNHKMAVEYLLRAIDNGYEKCGKEYYRLIVSLKDFGESFDDRILIIEESNGVEVEYQILNRLLGVRNKDWFLKQQSLIKENDIKVDKMDIELSSGETKSYYFDITRSFWKFDINHIIRNKNYQFFKDKSMNAGEQTVEWLYKEQLKIDEKWSVRTPNGFRWWADKHAQTIEVVGQEVSPDGMIAYIISVRTELLQSVDSNEKNLKHINSMLMPFMSMSGPFYDHNNKRLDLCSLVRVHDEISQWMNPLISMAAILQIGEARIMGASLAEALNAEEAVSGHPDHGIRPEPDELAEAIASLIAPMGAEPSRWKEWEFQDMDKFMNQFPSIVGTVGDTGFTVEFPYGDETSLCQVKNNEPHPRYGNGLFILQSFPLGDISEMKGIDLALLMNEIELTQEPLGYGLGSYVYKTGMLHFTSFFPNALYKPGMLANIFLSCAERANEISFRLMKSTPHT